MRRVRIQDFVLVIIQIKVKPFTDDVKATNNDQANDIYQRINELPEGSAELKSTINFGKVTNCFFNLFKNLIKDYIGIFIIFVLVCCNIYQCINSHTKETTADLLANCTEEVDQLKNNTNNTLKALASCYTTSNETYDDLNDKYVKLDNKFLNVTLELESCESKSANITDELKSCRINSTNTSNELNSCRINSTNISNELYSCRINSTKISAEFNNCTHERKQLKTSVIDLNSCPNNFTNKTLEGNSTSIDLAELKEIIKVTLNSGNLTKDFCKFLQVNGNEYFQSIEAFLKQDGTLLIHVSSSNVIEINKALLLFYISAFTLHYITIHF